MHKDNRHQQGYNFKALLKNTPELFDFIIKNKFNNRDTINFSDPKAVKLLNSALLKTYYKLSFWDIPDNYLCPPIPGRVDYIHHLNDLLLSTESTIDKKVRVLDIGTGASCIYPILGVTEHGWQFVASEIDPASIKMANKIIANNKSLIGKIECRRQHNQENIFNGVINNEEFYHLTLCNPPFHKSLAEATEGTKQKWQNLNKTNQLKSRKATTLNFGGQKAELWCPGGELAFIRKMIKESKGFAKQVGWFTCLVSKKEHISKLKLTLKKSNVSQVKVVNMAQGQKVSRFIAWRF